MTRITGLALAAVSLIVLQSNTALAERAQRKARGSRRLASVDGNPYANTLRAGADTRVPKTKDWSLRAGILGGYATTNTNTAAQAQRDNAGFDRNAYVGGTVDFKVKQYAGAEVEGFYNLAPSSSVTSIDRINGVINTDSRSLQQYGGMAHAKAQLPLQTGKMRWEPMIGLGYGMLGLKEKRVTGTSETSTENEAHGFYATAGLELELIRDFILLGDYARSFSASGSRIEDSPTALTGTTTQSSFARFERWRVGALYRFTPSFLGGLNYTGRRLTYALPSDGANTQETMNQFLGTLLVEF